jgi:hypothetical protein
MIVTPLTLLYPMYLTQLLQQDEDAATDDESNDDDEEQGSDVEQEQEEEQEEQYDEMGQEELEPVVPSSTPNSDSAAGN